MKNSSKDAVVNIFRVINNNFCFGKVSAWWTGCVACLLLSSGLSGHANAQTLQRFFLLPEDRAMLDKANAQEQRSSGQNSMVSIHDSIVIVEPMVVTLTGVVIRDNHQHTVWINGHALEIDELPPSLLLNSAKATVVQVYPDHGGFLLIEIGQEFSIVDADYIRANRAMLTMAVNNTTTIADVDEELIDVLEDEFDAELDLELDIEDALSMVEDSL